VYPNSTQSWSASLSTVVHSIHAAAKRVNVFNWHQSENYQDVTYPGILSNCLACHEPGTYDYSAANYTDEMMKNFVPSTTTTGTMYTTSTGTVYYGAYNTAGAVSSSAANLVISPITEKCIACHDTDPVKGHAESQGGQINRTRVSVP
jgi:OmcA/MtrC family decaheme c-type cytochrome